MRAFGDSVITSLITNDIEALWEQYPELRNNVNVEQEINSEEFTVKNYQGLKPIDGNISPEHYERFKVKLTNGQAEVLVHGMELYTFLDEDEVTIGEWQQFAP